MSSWVKKWSIASWKHPEKKYTVSLKSDGTYGCSCPAWKFQRKSLTNGHCKHINTIYTSDPVLIQKDGGTQYIFPKTANTPKGQTTVSLSSQEWLIDVLDVNESLVYVAASGCELFEAEDRE